MNEKELLISLGFEYSECDPMYFRIGNTPYRKNERPTFWVSILTGRKYPFSEYTNHGRGGVYRGFVDLPNEYPFTIEYESI